MRDKRPKPLTDKALRKRQGKGFEPVDSMAIHKAKQLAKIAKPVPKPIPVIIPKPVPTPKRAPIFRKKRKRVEK